MKNNKTKSRYAALVIALVLLMSFIILLAGHFLLPGAGTAGRNKVGAPSAQSGTKPSGYGGSAAVEGAVRYTHKSETIDGLKQEINILEIDPAVSGIHIRPVLSHDIIYGFETLSAMSQKKNAYAAVTGGFFSKYGLPAGMVVIDGELVSTATGSYPVFTVENGKASFKEFASTVTVEFTRAGSGQTGSIAIDAYNAPAGGRDVAVYTPFYGRTNRAGKPNITVTVENGAAVRTAHYSGEARIPENGMLITFFDTDRFSAENLPIKTGDAVKLSHRPDLADGADAYECGCWLARGGKAVVPLKDPWIGILTNRDPRTAIGIKNDGTVVLMTIDGRQPGYSAGFTGQELARYLIGLGVRDAAMLDGGASAEMLYKGRLVSRPSYDGEERPLGGGLLVLSGN